MNSLTKDEDTLRAILHLKGNDAWERVIWWFQSSFKKEMEGIDFSEGNQGAFQTGAVRQLHAILTNIQYAKETLSAIQRMKTEAPQLEADLEKILK